MAFKSHLTAFLKTRLEGSMPRLDPFPYDGRIPKKDDLRRKVEALLRHGSHAAIALSDVYTGTPDFTDANDAKQKMSQWVGPNPQFYPHAAQYEFEAWLLPFWSEIQKLAGHNRNAPSGPPEQVNHNRPPSVHIREIFRIGTCRADYSKPRDAKRILQGKDLSVAANSCPELKSFLNTILNLCGGPILYARDGHRLHWRQRDNGAPKFVAAPDEPDKLIQARRLVNEAARMQLIRFPDLARIVRTRHNHHGDHLEFRIVLDLREHRKPGFFRQVQIEKDQMRQRCSSVRAFLPQVG